jgi:hypothetical protein
MSVDAHQIRYVIKGKSKNQPVSMFLAKEYFSQKEKLKETLDCPICLETIDCVNCFCLLMCGHSFHLGCIISQSRCALCRE